MWTLDILKLDPSTLCHSHKMSFLFVRLFGFAKLKWLQWSSYCPDIHHSWRPHKQSHFYSFNLYRFKCSTWCFMNEMKESVVWAAALFKLTNFSFCDASKSLVIRVVRLDIIFFFVFLFHLMQKCAGRLSMQSEIKSHLQWVGVLFATLSTWVDWCGMYSRVLRSKIKFISFRLASIFCL